MSQNDTCLNKQVSDLILKIRREQGMSYTAIGLNLGLGDSSTQKGRRKAYLAVHRWVTMKHLPRTRSIELLCQLAQRDYSNFRLAGNLATYIDAFTLVSLDEAYAAAMEFEPCLIDSLVAHAAAAVYSMLFVNGIKSSLSIQTEPRSNGTPETYGLLSLQQSGLMEITLRIDGKSNYIAHSIHSNTSPILNRDDLRMPEFPGTVTFLKNTLREVDHGR